MIRTSVYAPSFPVQNTSCINETSSLGLYEPSQFSSLSPTSVYKVNYMKSRVLLISILLHCDAWQLKRDLSHIGALGTWHPTFHHTQLAIGLDVQRLLLLLGRTIYLFVTLLWHFEMTACHLWKMKNKLLTPLHYRKVTRHRRDHDLSPLGHGISESKEVSKIRSVENLDVEHREVLKGRGLLTRKGVKIGACHVLAAKQQRASIVFTKVIGVWMS